MVLANSTNVYSNSRFIVGATNSPYTTIQSAINAANAAGGNATVWVRSGTYTENLTLYDTVDIEGADSVLSIIAGTHTPPNSGAVSFTRIGLNSATHIFSSAAAGTTTITCSRCVFKLTNGYVFNLTDWTGILRLRYCLDNSTANGILTNTAGASLDINHGYVGVGSGNTLTANGNVKIFGCDVFCPVSLTGTGVSQIQGGSVIHGNVATADTHSLTIGIAGVSSGAAQAITHNSSNVLTFNNVVLNSSNAEAVGGTGTVRFNSVSFPSSYAIAATITEDLTGTIRTEQVLANNVVRMDDTGFYSWAAAGPYFDDTTLGTFKLLVGGTGYIKNERVTWVAQDITGLTAGSTWYIYIDSAGTIGKTATRTDALFVDYIVLFECLRDSTPITNNQVTVKENHAYSFQPGPSNWMHDCAGILIENNQNGANITLNGTQGIQINGGDVLNDHGLETTIPDSAGAAVTWIRMYTNAGGKWARQNATTAFTGFYNNAGTATALTANRYAVYRLYVSKSNLNATTPTYFAVLHTAQFVSIGAANTAISNGTIAGATNELELLELAQLGYIIYSEASASIVQVTISKSTLRSTISSAGTNIASLVTTVVTNFDGVLSSADTNVQQALETIDEFGKGLTDHCVVVGNGNGLPLGVIGAGTTGQLLVGAAAADPAFGSSAVGDFTFTSATAAQDRALTISNTDNSAATSAAHLQVTVGGSTSTGDPYVNFLVSAAGTYSLGIDNSVGDSFKFTNGASPSAGTALMTYNPVAPGIGTDYYVWSFVTPGSGTDIEFFNISGTNVAQPVELRVFNGDTTNTASKAVLDIRTGVGGGDAYASFVSSSQLDWEFGSAYIDGAFVLGSGGPPSSPVRTYFRAVPSGLMTIGCAAVNTPISVLTGTGAVNIGTDAVAKTVTLGNTTGASVLALKCGTGDFTLASATGTIISALDTGEVTMPLQSAFCATCNSAQNNVTGDYTQYEVQFTTERFDQNADYNGTSRFTAPITGRCFLYSTVTFSGLTANNTYGFVAIVTSNLRYFGNSLNPYVSQRNDGYCSLLVSTFCDMDAGDTAFVQLDIGATDKGVDIQLGNEAAYFSGYLVC